MGFDKPGGGGGGGGGGMTLLDQGTLSLADSESTYINVGITDATRNLWCNVTNETTPFALRRHETNESPTSSYSVAAVVQYSDNQGQWSIRISTDTNGEGDYRWFLYELPTG